MSDLPPQVVDAIRAWGEAMVMGPEKCTCEGHPGWNGGTEHSDGCPCVRAGLVEHYASKAAARAVRTWAESQAAVWAASRAASRIPMVVLGRLRT